MRLFKHQKPAGTSCPRCSQLVTAQNGDVCAMCGWDVREAYQGPPIASHGRATPIDPTDRESERAADHRVA
jgi:hypothetical protein